MAEGERSEHHRRAGWRLQDLSERDDAGMREPATDDSEACETDRREEHEHDVAVVRPLFTNVDEFVQRQEHEERDSENDGDARDRPHDVRI